MEVNEYLKVWWEKEGIALFVQSYAEMYHKKKLKQQPLEGQMTMAPQESGGPKVWDRVRVTQNLHGHEFNVGEEVDIVKIIPDEEAGYYCMDDYVGWWMSKD